MEYWVSILQEQLITESLETIHFDSKILEDYFLLFPDCMVWVKMIHLGQLNPMTLFENFVFSKFHFFFISRYSFSF